jgi:RimJ/RimL family protein N-acetyltransferase
MRIEGRTIVLRDIQRADMESKVRWFNDPQVNKTLLLEDKLDLQRTLQWFDERACDGSGPATALRFAETRREFIVESKQGEQIGITGLVHINPRHGTAECFCVIGEKAYWGKGLGTEVHTLLIDWGFKNLDLHKIWADIRAENAAIIKVIERLGFKVEGTLRQERIISGKRVDVVRIGLLRDEFYQLHPELS